jgi:hypothetical protein
MHNLYFLGTTRVLVNRLAMCLRILLWALAGSMAWQSAHAQTSPSVAASVVFPAGLPTKKVDEFLATLRPPTSFKALLSGNDLLLNSPDIARSGTVHVKAVSTIPRTDAMWLLTMQAMPDSGSAMFVGVQFDVSALPEINVPLQLFKTQSVLLVVRAGGKYYGLSREIKVGKLTGSGGVK